MTPLKTSRLAIVSTFFLMTSWITVFGADPKPAAAPDDQALQLQGEYTTKDRAVHVIALGGGQFQCVIYEGGLPGAGWNRKEPRRVEGDADTVLDLTEDSEKVLRKSPTLGAKPPEGAVVLFDGSQESLKNHWKEGAKVSDDGLLQVGVTSQDTFLDFSLHLEFLLPFMPEQRGQGRANSGLYLQGRYEVQILDSFGLEGKNNECGGFYSIKAPDQNLCFPPLSWQTYDVDFRAARFNETGEKTETARVTVRHNGVVIHRDVQLPNTTPGGPSQDNADPGPVFLQNHGNPVQFRNIWVIPRDFSKANARPFVSSFERFHHSLGDPQTTGRLLINELSCMACHQSEKNWQGTVASRQAPRLTDAGKRISPDYLREFLATPHDTKPGTTMPDLLAGKSAEERAEFVEPIVHFLASTGSFTHSAIDRTAVGRGKKLFHEIGCVACHAPEENSEAYPISVPLVSLEKKYSTVSLEEFLKNPHAVRPGGRMPGLLLEKDEPKDLAHYLLRNLDPSSISPSWNYVAYQSRRESISDQVNEKEIAKGTASSLDVALAGRPDGFSMVFTGFLVIDTPGQYRFHLGSDDGSRLLINEQELILNDGIHPHSIKSESLELTAGAHPIRVEYFEAAGEESLTLEVEGPNIRRQDISALVRPTPEAKQAADAEADAAKRFVFNQDLVELGRERFVSTGCANCHELKIGNDRLASTRPAPKAITTPSEQPSGCLAESLPAGVPDFALNDDQRQALQAVVSQRQPQELSAEQKISDVLLAFNCYGCHTRGGMGGPENVRNTLFVTTIPEMGDEGRIPPILDGIGDKLETSWLNHVLKNGGKDRPYMKTRMPQFAGALGSLSDLLVSVDQKTTAEQTVLDEPTQRIKATGRELVGGKSLACIKCHTFGDIPATGIQAIDLLTMTRRIREDWFIRYLKDPVQYRPGTRMPNVFPQGVSADRTVYEGKPGPQIAAMWDYLKDGQKAAIPYGLLPDPIELVPESSPIIYRNFIQDVSPRGIAVGYPEKVNLTFDADLLSLRLIWHGPFIDAGKHWRGRGQGTQVPLGDHVLKLAAAPAIAILASPDQAWPGDNSESANAQFLGYQLDDKQRPHFHYRISDCDVHEAYLPAPVAGRDTDLIREVNINRSEGSASLAPSYLIARAKSISKNENNTFEVTDEEGNAYQLVVEGSAAGITLRETGGKQELIWQIPAASSSLKLRYRW